MPNRIFYAATILLLLFSCKKNQEENRSYIPSYFPNKLLYKNILDNTEIRINKTRKTNIKLQLLDSDNTPITSKTFKIIQKKHQFLFGNIMQPMLMNTTKMDAPEAYKKRFIEYHNFAILPYYWAFYEPVQGETMDNKFPEIIKWGKENGIKLKGHPLAWGSRDHLPKWLFDLSIDSTKTLLLNRIEHIVKHYKNDISIWDVVNEPTHTSPWTRAMDTTQYHISNLSIKEISETIDWVEDCFKAAYRGNPNGTFILNDYQQFASADYRSSFYIMVKELLARGAPIHAIGLQAHNPKDAWFPPDKFLSVLDTYAELGLPIHITEFHPLSRGEKISGGWIEGTWNEEKQADYAEMLMRLSFSHPAVVSFTSWGLTDKWIWRDGAGYYDENYNPKPSAKRLSKLINKEWHTETSVTSDEDGFVTIEGFYGDYNIVDKNGNLLGEFSLENDTDNTELLINLK